MFTNRERAYSEDTAPVPRVSFWTPGNTGRTVDKKHCPAVLFANTTRHHGCSVNTVRVCRSVITARKHRYVECTDPQRGGCAAAVGVTTGYISVGKPHLVGNERRQCMDKLWKRSRRARFVLARPTDAGTNNQCRTLARDQSRRCGIVIAVRFNVARPSRVSGVLPP